MGYEGCLHGSPPRRGEGWVKKHENIPPNPPGGGLRTGKKAKVPPGGFRGEETEG
jgi:hypothetical protein